MRFEGTTVIAICLLIHAHKNSYSDMVSWFMEIVTSIFVYERANTKSNTESLCDTNIKQFLWDVGEFWYQ